MLNLHFSTNLLNINLLLSNFKTYNTFSGLCKH
jgi:hypothetical protein